MYVFNVIIPVQAVIHLLIKVACLVLRTVGIHTTILWQELVIQLVHHNFTYLAFIVYRVLIVV